MIEIQENKVHFDFNKSRLIDNFNKYSKVGSIYYPIKTNSNIRVLNVLKELNSGFLVTTLNNFEKIKELNIDKNVSRMKVYAADMTAHLKAHLENCSI